MDNLQFRDLRADEIECRVAMVKANGVSLLLYKDARCDMNILDETVGAMNWQKHYALIDGQLFCEVSIWDEVKSQWISKQDVGVESNTEAEKGRASDAQKRSAFAWGIGRELYTAPFIWVEAEDCNISNNKCYDKFIVQSITIEDKKITALSIYDETTKKVVFTMNAPKKATAKKTAKAEPKAAEPQTEEPPKMPPTVQAKSPDEYEPPLTQEELLYLSSRYKGENLFKLLEYYNIEDISLIRPADGRDLIAKIKAKTAEQAKG